MSLQRIIGTVFLICGLTYGIIFLFSVFKKTPKEDCELTSESEKNLPAYKKESGNLKLLFLLEGAVFFLCTLGISDFLLNTLIVKKLKLSEDRYLPSCLLASTIVPGSIIAFSYLKSDNIIDSLTLTVYIVCLAIGSFLGSKVVSKMNNATIKKVLGICLILSMIALIAKMIVSAGASGTLTGLRGPKLVLLGVLCLLIGFINMMGVPMKPPTTAALLLIGFSPITALTLLLVMGVINPVFGSIQVAKEAKYNKKMVLAAMTTGTAFAILGVALAVSLDPTVLNIILLAVMALAVYTILKPEKK